MEYHIYPIFSIYPPYPNQPTPIKYDVLHLTKSSSVAFTWTDLATLCISHHFKSLPPQDIPRTIFITASPGGVVQSLCVAILRLTAVCLWITEILKMTFLQCWCGHSEHIPHAWTENILFLTSVLLRSCHVCPQSCFCVIHVKLNAIVVVVVFCIFL